MQNPSHATLHHASSHPFGIFTVSKLMTPKTPGRYCLQTPRSNHLQNMSTSLSIRHLKLNGSKTEFIIFCFKPVPLLELSIQQRHDFHQVTQAKNLVIIFLQDPPQINSSPSCLQLAFRASTSPVLPPWSQESSCFSLDQPPNSCPCLHSLHPNPWSILCTTTRLDQTLAMSLPC